MGNRGVLHNDQGKVVRSWKTKAWITCVLSFKERHRRVFTPRRYSELFFLDEATAFAAGHRPCAECRYQDYKRFKQLWMDANPHLVNKPKLPAAEWDTILHEERIDKQGARGFFLKQLSELPDGVLVRQQSSQDVYLFYHGKLLLWHHGGYMHKTSPRLTQLIEVLTPYSIVRTFLAGYKPRIHPSSLQQLGAQRGN